MKNAETAITSANGTCAMSSTMKLNVALKNARITMPLRYRPTFCMMRSA